MRGREKNSGRERLAVRLSWTVRLILIFLFIFSTFNEQFPVNVSVLIAIFISFSPVLISRSYNFHFPPLVDLVIVSALLLDIIGRVFSLYHTARWWWWDIMTHLTGTATISLVAFYIMFSLMYLKRIKISWWMLGVFTFTFAMTIGALWEILEYYFDGLTGYDTYLNEANSIRDMVFDIFGGLTVSLLGAIYTKRLFAKKKIKIPA